jgi:hypothetical protein
MGFQKKFDRFLRPVLSSPAIEVTSLTADKKLPGGKFCEKTKEPG